MSRLQPRTEPQDEAPISTGEPPHHPPATRASGRRRLRWALFLLLPVALLAGGYFYVTGGQIMSTENAYVRADMVGVTTDVSGIVTQVAVHENQHVAAGEVLFRLDDQPFRLALTRAEAQLGIVANDLNAQKAGYRDMQAQIRQAQVEVDYDARELDRQRQLIARNVASHVTFEQAQRDLQAAQQKVASLNQQLAGIAAGLGGDPDLPVARHPRYVEAVAARDEAARQLAHATVRAPIAGTATNVPSLQPGQYLAAATAAFSIVATDNMWIEATPKETELTYVRTGQPVTVTIDTYPDGQWHGTVESVSPASASSFALLPAQNSSGNWVKVVQRIPMRVRLDPAQGAPPLRAGMSAVVSVDTGHARGLPPFLSGLFGGASGRAG
ncbi:HlyD family secretion protein [Roseomonas sp. M0104]|uniref:HlyD family secretion protein n=1 Tax=Teichococcus coralli TaxID=2545983 RepID=A0A845BG42_9PROT|nr:HlyD family secretion protein [Pseudoroseomonas coralli]MXP65066.1 HlyD family secretion protein [Pseudoroseomonas coralli]